MTRPLLDPAALRDFVRRVVTAAGVEREPGAGAEVEIIRRTDGETVWRFIVNPSAEAIEVDAHGTELVTGITVEGLLAVPAGAVRVIREERAA